MKQNIILLISLACSISCWSPAFAVEPTIEGTFNVTGDKRQATISQLKIRKVDGKLLARITFFGLPDDVDWGEVEVTAYPVDNNVSRYVASARHDGASAILILRPISWDPTPINEVPRLRQLQAASFVKWDTPTEKHHNFAHEDVLDKQMVPPQ